MVALSSAHAAAESAVLALVEPTRIKHIQYGLAKLSGACAYLVDSVGVHEVEAAGDAHVLQHAELLWQCHGEDCCNVSGFGELQGAQADGGGATPDQQNAFRVLSGLIDQWIVQEVEEGVGRRPHHHTHAGGRDLRHIGRNLEGFGVRDAAQIILMRTEVSRAVHARGVGSGDHITHGKIAMRPCLRQRDRA